MSLISLNSKLNKRKKVGGENRYSPAVEVCTEYTWQCQTSWVLSVVEFQDLCPWQQVAGKAEKCVSPAFYSKHVLWRRRWWWTHSSVWWSRWHGCSCMWHWIYRTTDQHQIIKVHVRMKVFFVIRLFKRPQRRGTVTENWKGFFCQLLSLLYSCKLDE